MMGKTKPQSKKTEGDAELGATMASNDGDGTTPVSLTDIQALLAGMEERIITNLTSQISTNHAGIAKHDETIQSIETSMNDFQDRITALEASVGYLSKENEQLKLKLDDLENRSRRCNIRITGIPEGEEGGKPTAFIESCLQEMFGEGAFPRPVVVDRAHRLNIKKKKRGDTRPRPFIACLHHFQMKQRVMELARDKGSLDYNGSEVHIFADYSAEVAKKRAAFAPIKTRLRNDGLHFNVLFPAKLRVNVNGATHDFSSPEEAAAFLDGPRLPPQPMEPSQED